MKTSNTWRGMPALVSAFWLLGLVSAHGFWNSTLHPGGANAALQTEANRFGGSSRHQDPVEGLNYHGYRYYNAKAGRWLSRDPAGEPVGPDLYAFVNNVPSGKIDALGLVTLHEGSVQRGEISYSCNCGWLDWTHFQFGAGFVDEIDRGIGRYEIDPSVSIFTMERTGPKSVLGARGSYQFVYRPHLDTRSRVLLNLDLLMRMSLLYESAQKGFLFNVAGGFSVEDLPSNYIGALERLNILLPGSTGIDREKVKELCHVLDAKDSLKMYKFGSGPRENRSHIPKLWSWRGWGVETYFGGPGNLALTRIARDDCDPCVKASKELPKFFSDFPVDKAGGLYRVTNGTTWTWWIF